MKTISIPYHANSSIYICTSEYHNAVLIRSDFNRHVHLNDGKAVFGMWKGVRVGVIRTNGKIATIFSDSKQPYKTKKKGGKSR